LQLIIDEAIQLEDIAADIPILNLLLPTSSPRKQPYNVTETLPVAGTLVCRTAVKAPAS
jgi:hypothetical protein